MPARPAYFKPNIGNILLAAPACLALPFFVLGCIGLVWRLTLPLPDRDCEVVEDPVSAFTAITGLAWPEVTAVFSAYDNHDPNGRGEGELHLVFDTDRATLDQWLAGPAPWGVGSWMRGPIEPGIPQYFGTMIGGKHHQNETYRRELQRALASTNLWYAAEASGRVEGMRWHSGTLLLIDLDKKRVWLSSWDM